MNDDKRGRREERREKGKGERREEGKSPVIGNGRRKEVAEVAVRAVNFEQ
jgi:hypothetical protein